MLSDKTIRRDKHCPVPRKILLETRQRTTGQKRQQLNEILQRELKDAEFTIFSNNCLGGIFYHDAGKRFTSPLINTAMDGEDFIRFLENPEHYLSGEMKFITWKGHHYPIAHIDDIEVRFVHYPTNEEAEAKWRERSKRIVWDNVFIVATNHDGLGNEELLKRFDQLPYQNKVMFVSHEYPQYEWAVCVPQFKDRFQVRIMTHIANFHGQRYYETCFDLAKWIKTKSQAKQESSSRMAD